MPGNGHEDEPEQEDRDRDDHAGPEDVVDEAIDVLDLGDHRPAQVGDSLLHDAKAGSCGDQIGTPGKNNLATIAVPRMTRKRANTNRTFEDFAWTRSRVPRFVPENTPMITMAAIPGSTSPRE